MINSSVLLRIYQDVTGRNLNVDKQEDRIIFQKTVFLLKEMGITIGDYRFAWDKYGPFSQSLNNDLFNIDMKESFYLGGFSKETSEKINFISNIVKNYNSEYGLKNWIEAIASFLYLKKYLYPLYSWEEIDSVIKSIKPYLSNDTINTLIIENCKKIQSYKE